MCPGPSGPDFWLVSPTCVMLTAPSLEEQGFSPLHPARQELELELGGFQEHVWPRPVYACVPRPRSPSKVLAALFTMWGALACTVLHEVISQGATQSHHRPEGTPISQEASWELEKWMDMLNHTYGGKQEKTRLLPRGALGLFTRAALLPGSSCVLRDPRKSAGGITAIDTPWRLSHAGWMLT